jgi:signal peptidase
MNLTRQSLAQLINALLVLTSSFMFYKGLSVVAYTESPVVVVLSGSMEPAFERGDVLFLWNRESRVKVGDIAVYNVKHRDIPIVHRVLRSHSS